jgi:hypothetical protein
MIGMLERQIANTITVGKLMDALKDEDRDRPLVYKDTRKGYPTFNVLRIEDLVIIEEK